MNLPMTRSAAAAVAVLFLVAPGLPVTALGVAHAAGDDVTQTLNVADPTPCCGNPEPNATSQAQANSLVKTGVGRADTLLAEVTIPIPSSGLGITDTSTADIRLVLSRGGQDYAECFLALGNDNDNDENNDNESNNDGSATFRVSIVKVVFMSLTAFKQLAGQCDLNLPTGGIQPGVPTVQGGDLATASSVVNSVRTKFLQGTFVQQ